MNGIPVVTHPHQLLVFFLSFFFLFCFIFFLDFWCHFHVSFSSIIKFIIQHVFLDNFRKYILPSFKFSLLSYLKKLPSILSGTDLSNFPVNGGRNGQLEVMKKDHNRIFIWDVGSWHLRFQLAYILSNDTFFFFYLSDWELEKISTFSLTILEYAWFHFLQSLAFGGLHQFQFWIKWIEISLGSKQVPTW